MGFRRRLRGKAAFFVIAAALAVVSCDGASGAGDTAGASADIPGDAFSADVPAAPDAGAFSDVAVTPDVGVLPDTAADAAAPVDTSMAGDLAPVTPVDGDPPHPWFGYVGRVQLVESYDDGGGPGSASFEAWLRDRLEVRPFVLAAREGDCELWQWGGTPTCEPPCPSGSRCGLESACEPDSQPFSAGTLTVTGGAAPLAIRPEAPWGTYTGSGPLDDPFAPDDHLTFSATGGDVEPFSVTLPGVGEMVRGTIAPVTLADGVDASVSWVPQGDGARVEVALVHGHHRGGPSELEVIWCAADEANGGLVIPASFFAGFPYDRNSLPGSTADILMDSRIRRVHRRTIDTRFGPIEILVASGQWLTVKHPQP